MIRAAPMTKVAQQRSTELGTFVVTTGWCRPYERDRLPWILSENDADGCCALRALILLLEKLSELSAERDEPDKPTRLGFAVVSNDDFSTLTFCVTRTATCGRLSGVPIAARVSLCLLAYIAPQETFTNVRVSVHGLGFFPAKSGCRLPPRKTCVPAATMIFTLENRCSVGACKPQS